jgi:hypothetical protein
MRMELFKKLRSVDTIADAVTSTLIQGANRDTMFISRCSDVALGVFQVVTGTVERISALKPAQPVYTEAGYVFVPDEVNFASVIFLSLTNVPWTTDMDQNIAGHRLVILQSYNEYKVIHAWHDAFNLKEFMTHERFARVHQVMSREAFVTWWRTLMNELWVSKDVRDTSIVQNCLGCCVLGNCSKSWFVQHATDLL